MRPRRAAQPPPKLGLVFAGGGLKVAFQAGVLQVLLDETDKKFEVADGASGGVFNLAMWCQGMTGKEIADAWRRTSPWRLMALNLRPWRSLLTYGRFRRNILQKTWGLDWDVIRRSQKVATFNAYNVTRQRLETFEPSQMSEDLLVAGVSLPSWFPPVRVGGDLYIDAVYATDANLEAAIHNGATELWVIWTVSTKGRWRNGPVNQYFQVIEAAANSRLEDCVARVKASNESIEKHGWGEFPHHVELEVLRAEVPLHYILVFSGRQLHEAVDLGVQFARQKLNLPNPSPPDDGSRLCFSESMTGAFTFGCDDPVRGEAEGRASGTRLAVRTTVQIDGVPGFLDDPLHRARLVGSVVSDALGGKLSLEPGSNFNLFVYAPDGTCREMCYRAFVRDGAGHPLTLSGEKRVPRFPSWHPWRDTTTLYVRILRGWVDEAGEPGAEIVGAGVVHLSVLGVLRELLSFRARGAGRLAAMAGIGLVARFLAFFCGVILRVYLHPRPAS